MTGNLTIMSRLTRVYAGVAGLSMIAVLVGASAEAQTTKYQIRVMEGVLENAVQHGAQSLNSQMRELSPDLVFFSGPARARGYRIEGYGVFFSVDVPALRRSLAWSFRQLQQDNVELGRALQQLRRHVQSQGDARAKVELEQALRLVELQVGPMSAPEGTARRANVAPDGIADRVIVETRPSLVEAPDVAYTNEVKRALVDAMLDYGTTLGLANGEWLTIAARDNEDTMVPGDMTDSVTITLRVKGSDLAEFRAERLSRDEVRQRVDVREF
jgi:hypothetical protein